MIVSFRDKRARELAEGNRVKAFSGFERKAELKLDQLEAATSIRCWRFARGLELWARYFAKIPSSESRRYRQCDPRLRHTMDLMGLG